MKKFYVITNTTKDPQLHITDKVCDLLTDNGALCKVEARGDELTGDVECILVLGGDGTILRAARDYYEKDIPMIGVNIGTLGYLTEVELNELEASVGQLIDGEPVVEERMMLHGMLNDNFEDVALNDIVMSRFSSIKLICFNIYVNGKLLNTYQADGVIISTPTGSTAYNISAGGPIVEPTASMIVITPICSHALNTSSIVLSADDEIVLEVGIGRDGSEQEVMLSFDGEKNVAIKTGDKIRIKRAKETTKLLKISKVSFLEILRKKMEGK